MTKRRDLSLCFELHHCQHWQSADDLLAGIKLLLDHAPLVPLENRMVPVGGGKLARPVQRDLPAWFAADYQTRDEWDPIELRWPSFQASLTGSFRLVIKDEWRSEEPISGALELSLDACRFGDTYNVVEFLVYLMGTTRAFPGRPSDIPYANTIAQVYLDFARPLIEYLRPEYAVISDADHFNTYGWDVIASRLQCIHWCNYWGPSYLERYGADLWQTPSGWKTEPWADGIWYQVTEDFRAFGSAERRVIDAFYAGKGVRAATLINYGESDRAK